jgi:hypothetical protein
MSTTSRELVYQALEFRNPARVPRIMGSLPIARLTHPEAFARITVDFPADVVTIPGAEKEPAPARGDPYEPGESVDAWGARFVNLQRGVHGEVKEPIVRDWRADRGKIHVPREWLTLDRDAVNRACAQTDRFTLGGCCPRPFEQLQFLRGTAELYVDLVDPPPGFQDFVDEMHAFYAELLGAWARTDVDALTFMDDWGSQTSLLISPELWRTWFKPKYRDYIQIAHAAGKKIHMHSDGHILAVLPDLIELGLDSVNAQIFCMGIDALKPWAGKITFWGEVDRQYLLARAAPAEVDAAVREVYAKLWRGGGCVAHCEFGAGAKPENVRQVFETWNRVHPPAARDRQ